MPHDVKKQFYLDTATLYPDYNAILDNVDKVVQTLNKTGLNSKDSTMKHPNNNPSSKAQLINSVTNQPSSSSKSGYKGRRNRKKTNCRFCQSADHTTTNCTKHPTPESRVAALRSRFGSDVCHKCTYKHTGACRERFWGYCVHDKSCKSNPHQFTLCPIKCKALATKTTKPTLVETIRTLPNCNASISEKPKLQKAELRPKNKN